MMANAGLLKRSSDISEAASRRLVHLLLDGFRASAATEGPPAPSARGTSVRCDATANVASDHPAARPAATAEAN